MNQNQRDKNRRTARALENMAKIETEVKRLREAGWKKQDFAQALKNLIEEVYEDRELIAAELKNREECKMNPLYTAYAKSHGMSEAEVLARDREQYPGGCMTGFILFVADMKRKFWEVCPEAFFCKRTDTIVDIDAFNRFVMEQVK